MDGTDKKELEGTEKTPKKDSKHRVPIAEIPERKKDSSKDKKDDQKQPVSSRKEGDDMLTSPRKDGSLTSPRSLQRSSTVQAVPEHKKNDHDKEKASEMTHPHEKTEKKGSEHNDEDGKLKSPRGLTRHATVAAKAKTDDDYDSGSAPMGSIHVSTK